MTGAQKKSFYTEMKAIRLTKEQSKNWDPELIRNILSNDPNFENKEAEIYISIIKKFIPSFLSLGVDIEFNNKEFKIIKQIYEKWGKE